MLALQLLVNPTLMKTGKRKNQHRKDTVTY